MNGFVKYLGVLVLLIGVAILAVPFVSGTSSNTMLIAGFAIMLVGYLGHIMLNRKAE